MLCGERKGLDVGTGQISFLSYFFQFYWEIVDVHCCVSLRCTSDDLTYAYCEMIITISSLNSQHLIQTQKRKKKKKYISPCDESS